MRKKTSGGFAAGVMKKIRKAAGWTAPAVLIASYAVLITLITGCTAATSDNADRIGSPVNQTAPLEGSWKLVSCFPREDGQDNEEDDEGRLSGEVIGFSGNSMIFGGDLLKNVSYKIKRVETGEYFLHKNHDMPEVLKLKGDDIYIISTFTDYKYSFEFIKDIDGKVIAIVDEQYYRMEKVSDSIDYAGNTVDVSDKSVTAEEENPRDTSLNSGLLLGVRIPISTEDGLGDYEYRTYWISANDGVLRPVYYAENIYLPRKDGFWMFQVRKKLEAEGVEDYLYASRAPMLKVKDHAASKGAGISGDSLKNSSGRLETKLRKVVEYIGNDYVCVENILYDNSKSASSSGVKTLRTLSADNLDGSGIKISDLAGENGTMAMESAISEMKEDIKSKGIKYTGNGTTDLNFSLFRKTGHWFFKGRLNFDAEGQLPYMDYNLNLIPPEDMVAYDTLQVPWKEMKDKLPQAVDIYTSPNGNLAVILTQNEMLFYAIENKSLSDEPLGRLSLTEGSAVVMAEWCTDNYVESWERSFLKNNDTSVAEVKSGK